LGGAEDIPNVLKLQKKTERRGGDGIRTLKISYKRRKQKEVREIKPDMQGTRQD